jgi:Zn-dependent peptidase ImmA (M78 family)/DNA-binding XRE family transcriptional regulator
MPPQRAHIEPAILLDVRKRSGVPQAEVAKAAGVAAEVYAAWEAGTLQPTITQLRSVGRKLNLSIAVFFLSEPPQGYSLPKDFRVVFGASPEVTAGLVRAVQDAHTRREAALDLLEDLGEAPRILTMRARMSESPDAVAAKVRSLLGVTIEEQRAWARPEDALDAWRAAAERVGVFVFQASKLPATVRAFSVAADVMPVVVLNRKDAVVARSFSLAHEFAHLVLHASGICDPFRDIDRMGTNEARVEVFCNAVAGALLIPTGDLRALLTGGIPSDAAIVSIAKVFGTSAEAVVRRLATIGVVDDAFYRRKRDEYATARAARPVRKGGPVAPPIDVLSRVGKPYARLVLAARRAGALGPADAAAYLGTRLRHFPGIEAALTRP